MNEQLSHSEQWIFTHSQLRVKIVRTDQYNPSFASKNCWCYYVSIAEYQTQRFKEIWLRPKIDRENKRISYAYLFNDAFADADFHGGPSFYQRHGQVPGFRSVEIGCDFQHLWDEDRDYSLEDVIFEARRTAEKLAEKYLTDKKELKTA